MFSGCDALIVCYDNVQRNQPLQYQRGGHSSSFIKGTTEVIHEVYPFTNTSYDTMFVELTYYNQAIPSPFGMPSFEEIDLSDPVSVSKMIAKELLPNYVTPDFTGETPVCP